MPYLSQRAVDLPPKAIGVLHDIKACQLLLATEHAYHGPERGSCSASRTGAHSTSDMVTCTFHRRMLTAGVEGLRFHDLRHSFASFMIAAGVDPKRIQAALGHSSIMVTLDIYGHLMPGAGRDAADRFAEYLEKR